MPFSCQETRPRSPKVQNTAAAMPTSSPKYWMRGGPGGKQGAERRARQHHGLRRKAAQLGKGQNQQDRPQGTHKGAHRHQVGLGDGHSAGGGAGHNPRPQHDDGEVGAEGGRRRHPQGGGAGQRSSSGRSASRSQRRQSPAPATTAPITRGIRSCQITTKERSSPSPSRARHTSPRDRSDEPALADASIRNAVRDGKAQ